MCKGGGEGASKSKTYILVLAKMFWLKMANKGNASLGLGFWMHLRLSGSSFGADLGSSFWMQLRLSGSSFGADLGSSFWMHLSLGVWSFGAKWHRKCRFRVSFLDAFELERGGHLVRNGKGKMQVYG